MTGNFIIGASMTLINSGFVFDIHKRDMKYRQDSYYLYGQGSLLLQWLSDRKFVYRTIIWCVTQNQSRSTQTTVRQGKLTNKVKSGSCSTTQIQSMRQWKVRQWLNLRSVTCNYKTYKRLHSATIQTFVSFYYCKALISLENLHLSRSPARHCFYRSISISRIFYKIVQ